jgi:hypothetical protein
MKKIITLLAASVLLIACKGNMYGGDKHDQKEKLHNKGVAIEKHAPRHMDNVTRDVANRASSASLKK